MIDNTHGKTEQRELLNLLVESFRIVRQAPYPSLDLDEHAAFGQGSSRSTSRTPVDPSRASMNRAASAISCSLITLPAWEAIASNVRSLQTRHITAWATPWLVPSRHKLRNDLAFGHRCCSW